MEDHVSPLSSSIGGIENLAREEKPVGVEQCLLHHQRSGLPLSGVNNKGFPSSSAGKESACSVGDPGLIPGSGGATGEGIGYSLH